MSNNTLQFDLTARREKNLRVLKSIDENVIEILEDYSHVAVYEFDSSQRKWERLDVEGSLFITRSLSDPFYSLIVLNKKGPSDFALDILNVLKISLQRPYLMLRCSTAGAPITFGIWSHSDAELDSLYAIIVRIALHKECPVAPPSPHQVKAAQLLSVLKLRKDNTSSGAAAGSPKTPTSNTASAAAFLSPEAPQTGTSGKQNGSSAKASALLSLLKPNGNGENTTVQSNVASLVVEENTSGASKSMQLLSLLKQVSQSPAPAAKVENNNNNNTTKSNGLNHIKVHKPSANSPINSPAPVATSAPSRSMEEDKRAELMLKLIKPRNTTVDDLLTDVDIAAKVKAAAAAPATSTPVDATTGDGAEPSSISSSSSKQDLLKNLLMKSKSPAPSTSSTPIPVPVPAMVLPSAAAGPSAARSPSPAVPVCAAAVGFLPIPTPPGRSTAASPVTGIAASAASTTNETSSAAATGVSATQRSADLLAAALRHSAQHIRTIQAATAASAAAASSTGGPSPTPAMMAARTPSASPVLKGMQAPVAWASLSSRENSFSLQQGSGLSAGIAANNSAAGSLSSKGPSPPATAANGAAAVPPRAQPVLISPSDLRNIAAASR